MSCNCASPKKTSLWTPIPEFRQPTAMLPGENIDCYMVRAGTSGAKDDVAEKIINKIDNNSITSDLDLNVDMKFILTPGSTKTAVTWAIYDVTDGTEYPITLASS